MANPVGTIEAALDAAIADELDRFAAIMDAGRVAADERASVLAKSAADFAKWKAISLAALLDLWGLNDPVTFDDGTTFDDATTFGE